MNPSISSTSDSMMFPRLFRLLLASGTLMLAACRADSAVGPSGALPDRVSIARLATPLASFGDTAVLSTTVLDAEGRALSAVPLRWIVSAPDVLEPLGGGQFRARANGTAVVRVEVDPSATGARPRGYFADRLTDSIVVTVQQQPARIVPINADTIFTLLGVSRTIGVRITDARDHVITAPVTPQWISSNESVMRVEHTGRVTARGNGHAIITVRAGNASWSGAVRVNASRSHVSCMQFVQRKRQQQQCVTNTVTMWAPQEKTP